LRNYAARWWPLKEREIVKTRVSRRTFAAGQRLERSGREAATEALVPYFLSAAIAVFAIGFEPEMGTIACSYGVPAHIMYGWVGSGSAASV